MFRMTPKVRRDGERGQIIVIFALGLVAILAMVGLVLDGGATFASRRGQQNAADLAALAGANSYLANIDKAAFVAQAAADAAARTTATNNGYTNNTNGATVNVTFDTSAGAQVKVDISAPHRNSFAGVVGMPVWTISTTATALTGFPDTARGAAPFIFNVAVFESNGNPQGKYADKNSPFTFGDGNGDVPNDPNDIAWTCYGTCGNVDSSTVRNMIDGSAPIDITLDPTVDFTKYIGQKNNGNHSTLFGEVADYLTEEDVSVPIVDNNGMFQGWATFHVTGTDQGGKTITGYFKQKIDKWDKLTVKCPVGGCPRYFGSYELRLVN